MDLSALLNAAFGAGMVTAAALAGLSRGRVANLREDNTDLRDSRDDARTDAAEARAAEALKDAELQRKQAELDIIRASLTGKVEWTQVVKILAEHDAKAAETWAEILDQLHKIKAAVLPKGAT